jgi:hypothetical protein
VWGLGVVLVNLTCVRNPWSKASARDDATYRAFLRQPRTYLRAILPISDELNDILIDIFAAGPDDRIGLRELGRRVAACGRLTRGGEGDAVDALSQKTTAAAAAAAAATTTTMAAAAAAAAAAAVAAAPCDERPLLPPTSFLDLDLAALTVAEDHARFGDAIAPDDTLVPAGDGGSFDEWLMDAVSSGYTSGSSDDWQPAPHHNGHSNSDTYALYNHNTIGPAAEPACFAAAPTTTPHMPLPSWIPGPGRVPFDFGFSTYVDGGHGGPLPTPPTPRSMHDQQQQHHNHHQQSPPGFGPAELGSWPADLPRSMLDGGGDALLRHQEHHQLAVDPLAHVGSEPWLDLPWCSPFWVPLAAAHGVYGW